MPQEFTTVTASSYDAAGLATKLTEKSADGWDVVSVVSTGTEIAAILSCAATGAPATSSAATDPSSSSTPTYAAAAATTAASEPAGWGTTSSAASSPAGGYSAG